MVTTSPNLMVLHALRCLGSTVPARLAVATGLDASDVESELIDLAVTGLVTFERGGFGGWSLTAAGKAADADRISAELDAAGARPAVTAAYQRFLELNPEVPDICTAWQTMDRADPTREARVLARLVDVDERAEKVLADLAAAVSRFDRYRVRLTAALDLVRAGRSSWSARRPRPPTCAGWPPRPASSPPAAAPPATQRWSPARWGDRRWSASWTWWSATAPSSSAAARYRWACRSPSTAPVATSRSAHPAWPRTPARPRPCTACSPGPTRSPATPPTRLDADRLAAAHAALPAERAGRC